MNQAKNKSEPWAAFWARQANQGGGGCLPGSWTEIEQAQKQAWNLFADRLPPGSKVLDLATGDARVLRWLKELRPDVLATGIDLAPQLPPPPPGVELRAGVPMEQLPFEPDSFDAITSQFGFEYGDPSKVGLEIDRVARSAATLGLMVHRGDGPILEHNVARAIQIHWVLDDRRLIESIIELSAPGLEGLKAAANLAGETARHGVDRWGRGSAAWEIPEAIRRTLVVGARGPRSKLVGTLHLIRDQARSEIGRIEALAKACEAADNRSTLLAGFSAAEFAIEDIRSVAESSGRAIADLIILRR